jgi:phosphate transport system permease protein
LFQTNKGNVLLFQWQKPTKEARLQKSAFFDRLFKGSSRLAAVSVLLLILSILVSLLMGAQAALDKFGLHFALSTQWNPVTEDFGALVAVFGTVVTSTIAIMLALPLSFGIAMFITELAPPWLKRPVGTAIELLAAIPSIIYGMWGLFVFSPWFADNIQPWMSEHLGSKPVVGYLFQGPPMGIGVLTAGLILAIMILPFISAMMRDVFEIVPARLKESAYGLGATTWEVLLHIVLPYTKSGVVGSAMLGLGRALGETMAVTFVIGNAQRIHGSLFMPGTTISSTLANEFTEAVGDIYTSSLFALGLMLFLITMLVLVLAKRLLAKTENRAKGTG